MNGTYMDDDIIQMIRDNYGREITECPDSSERYRTIGTLYVDEKSFDYYIWWRTCIRNDTFPEANRSLIGFFIKELFVMNESEQTIERWLRYFSKIYANEDYVQTITDILCDFHAMKGEFPPTKREIKGTMTKYSMPLVLSGPSITLDARQIGILANTNEELPCGFDEFFSRVLENMACTLWECFDSSIIEFMSHEREEYLLHPMKSVIADMPPVLIDAPFANKTFDQRFGNLFQNCLRTYNNRFKNKKATKCDAITQDAINRALSDIKTNGIRPTEWHPERFVTIREYDGRKCRGRYDPEHMPYPWECSTIFINESKITMGRERPLKGEIVEFSKIKSDGQHGYVRCRTKCPLPSSLGKDEMDYYLYWREQFRTGNYLPTDEDYLSLFLYETVITDTDATSTMDVLLKLADGYRCRLVTETCMSFAISNGLELPNLGDSVGDSSKGWTAYVYYDALKRNPMGRIPYKMIASFLKKDKTKYAETDVHGFTELANKLVNGFDEYYHKEKGKRLFDIGSQNIEKINVPIFECLSFYNLSRPLQLKIPLLLDSNELSDVLYAAYVVALETICKRNGCGYPRVKDVKAEYRSIAKKYIDG